jgi:hypothetical protein
LKRPNPAGAFFSAPSSALSFAGPVPRRSSAFSSSTSKRSATFFVSLVVLVKRPQMGSD